MGQILGLQSGGEEEEKGRAHPGGIAELAGTKLAPALPNIAPPPPHRGPGYHTRTSELRAWLLRAAQACFWSTEEGSLGVGLPLPPSPPPPFQALLRGHLLGPPGGTKQQFRIPVP